MSGGVIIQIVSVDRSYNRMFQSKQVDGLSYFERFVGVECLRFTGVGIAEFTGTGANIAGYHECGCFVVPTFAAVGTSSARADSMQALFFYYLAGNGKIGVIFQAYPQPFRFAKVSFVHATTINFISYDLKSQ
jgi:hypothetical protein